MPSLGDAGAVSQVETPDRRKPTWPRIAVVAAVLVLAFVISRGSSSDVTQDEAVAAATDLVSFVPEDTQVRFLRQGLDRHPFWVVSLSIPKPGVEQGFSKLAVVRIDAESGEVVEFREQKPEDGGGKAP